MSEVSRAYPVPDIRGSIDLFGYIWINTSPKQEKYNSEEPTLRSRVEQSPAIAVGGMQIRVAVD